MAFLENLEKYVFKGKNLVEKVWEKRKNPKTYIPLIPYFNLWYYNKYSKKKNLIVRLSYGIYAVPPTLKLAWIGIGILTGIWNPVEQYKTIKNFIKSEKEIYQEINKEELNLHTNYLTNPVMHTDSI